MKTGNGKMKVIEILSSDQFECEIENGVTLIDFSTPWCAPCRIQDPIVRRLAERFEGRARIAKMNVSERVEIAANLAIQSIPTLALFKNGREIERFVGLQSEETLVDALAKTLGGE